MRFELTEWLKELGLQLLCTRHAALSLSLSPPPLSMSATLPTPPHLCNPRPH